MVLERIQAIVPEATVRRQPGVDLGERLRADLVPASLGVLTDPHQAGVAEHLQMLRDARLTDAELVDEIANRALTLAQQIQDTPSGGLSKNLERGRHTPILPVTYIRVKVCRRR